MKPISLQHDPTTRSSSSRKHSMGRHLMPSAATASNHWSTLVGICYAYCKLRRMLGLCIDCTQSLRVCRLQGRPFRGRRSMLQGLRPKVLPGSAGWASGLSGRSAGSRSGIDWWCLLDRCRTLQPTHISASSPDIYRTKHAGDSPCCYASCIRDWQNSPSLLPGCK